MNYFLRTGMLSQSKHVDYFTLDVSTFITYVRLEFLKKMQECVGLAVLDKLTCALRSWWASLYSALIHYTNSHSSCLLSPLWPGCSVDWTLYTSRFCFSLLTVDELWPSETLPFASSWFSPICMDSQFEKRGREKNGLLFTPPNADMWSSLTVAFVVVDLTWSTFCVHIFRRQLQTNMAVRLCDVASLLRSGSWAPEPWTGVCGTFIFIFGNYLSRRALCLSAQAIPMIVLVL